MIPAVLQATRRPRLPLLLGTAAALTLPLTAHGAGFALLEQSGSGLGNAFAGIAASSDDVSAMYFNPATLASIGSPRVAVVLHGINLETDFRNRGSTLPAAGLGALPAGATRSDAGDFIPVPNAYIAWPLNEQLTFGFGLNTPFGLVTEYDDPWIGRFQGIRSELATINANPALSYRLSDAVTLGIGVNYQFADAELTNAVLLGPGVEGRAAIEVDDYAWGWNVGALFTLPTATRVGVSYRSRLDYSLTGDTRVTALAGGAPIAAASGPTSVDITFPDSAHLSAAHPIGDAFELRADVHWTNWSEVGTVFAINTNTGQPRDVLEFAFEDTIRVALGANYEWNDRWTFRAGTAWDESPVRDEVRTVRLPDSDRWWLSVGASWRPTESLRIDGGYTRIFVDDPEINLARGQIGAPPSFASTVVGDYESTVGIYSVQLSWSFR